MINELSNLLISTFFYFAILIIFLRLLFQLIRADFHNPISQFVVNTTQPVLGPLRKAIPAIGPIDTASVLLIIMLKVLELTLKSLIVYGSIASFYQIFALTIIGLVDMLLNFYFFAVIGQIILSWVAPHNPNPAVALLHQITEPLMRPARKVLPPISGIDFSPILVFLVIQVLEILLVSPQGLLSTFFGGLGNALGLM